MRIQPYTKEELSFAEKLHRETPLSLYEILLDQRTRITELEAQLADLESLVSTIATGQPIWPNNWRQDVAMVAHEIHVRQAQLADSKQVANDCQIAADNAIADLEPYRKDAERYRWLCDKGYNYHGAMSGSGSMSLCRGPYILLEPPSLNAFSNMILGKPAADAIIDAAIQAEGKA